MEIVLDGQEGEKGEHGGDSEEAEGNSVLLVGGKDRGTPHEADKGDEDEGERGDRIDEVQRRGDHGFALPQEFSLPEGGEIAGDKGPEAVPGEDGMSPPLRKGFIGPAEDLDFQDGAGEVAEIGFAPEHPADDGEAGGEEEDEEGDGYESITGEKDFYGDGEGGQGEEGEVAGFGQISGGEGEAKAGGETGGEPVGFEENEEEDKDHAESDGGKEVVVDGIKGGLGHEGDEGGDSAADENIFGKDDEGGEPGETDEEEDEGDIEETEPIEEAFATKPESFAEAPPTASDTVVERRLGGFVIFEGSAVTGFAGLEAVANGGDGLFPGGRGKGAVGLGFGGVHVLQGAVDGDVAKGFVIHGGESAGNIAMGVADDEVEMGGFVDVIEKGIGGGKDEDVESADEGEQENEQFFPKAGVGGRGVHARRM